MDKNECRYFRRSNSASPEKEMVLYVEAEIDGQKMPVFGVETSLSTERFTQPYPQSGDYEDIHSIDGICAAFKERAVAVASPRYSNFCSTYHHRECVKFKAAEKKFETAENWWRRNW